MAVLADETCVAQSNRSMVSLSDYRPSSYEVPGATPRGLPWRRQVVELVEDLALERLPEHLTARDPRAPRPSAATPQPTATRTRGRPRDADADGAPRDATGRSDGRLTAPSTRPAGGSRVVPPGTSTSDSERRLRCLHELVGA